MDLCLKQDIPDPAELEPDLPDALRKFVIKACARDLCQRYQNIAEIVSDLRQLTDKNGAEKNSDYSENRKVATMFLVYKDEHQPALFRMMEEFCESVNVLGIDCKTTEFTGLNLEGRADSLY
jgi:hypothetical protein